MAAKVQLTTDQLKRIVCQGALYFDQRNPKWATGVKIESIDVSRVETSVVAQVLGGEWDETVGLKDAYEKGFIFPPETARNVLELANKLWRVEVRTRRPGRPSKAAQAAMEA